ncbi:MAG: 2,3,4,5-tetrahydropyridine-2,6-dicarboxylate N-succinyltransferase [Desulfobulbaceae bacterium]|nr:2,3,4,5-tetrahydropyridine-2,6-dicarboxylate N-succinyltransferase [Candidatus Kapabacteria bacterium]MBS4001120.1 2,3,4,5-tetrahydropyridine-2,6-dicarboxylate N-succinyltransferase [Desulfobulbaceae bacterium]
MEELRKNVESYFESGKNDIPELFLENFAQQLDNGKIRAAEPLVNGEWQVNQWVKKGILLLFRAGKMHDFSNDDNFKFFDKHTLPTKHIELESNIRIVPGGSTIRRGAYVAEGVICMPPMYINIGSYIDSGTMIDSHALVGTCAQIGKNVHISAAAQIGGVLEPAGARPVIVEENVMVGGNCGIYEGVRVRKNAVLASGVILTASTKIYDLVNETIITSDENTPLEVPENAVLVAGSRKINSEFALDNGLSIYTPLIIKYRDSKTDAKTALNFDLR